MRHRGGAALAALSALALALAACTVSTPANPPSSTSATELVPVSTHRPDPIDTKGLPPALVAMFDTEAGFLTRGADTFEVWICEVPESTTSSSYEPGGIRLDLDASTIAAALNASVTDFGLELSSGVYRPQFVGGGDLTLAGSEGPDECFTRALALSSAEATGVLAIATAEHRAGTSGGFGQTGTPCLVPAAWPCPASTTERGVSLGASDFHPDWGTTPAVDLLEHELGHVLGWPHSGQRDDAYASVIDLMSNSAAPRSVDPAARHGQGTLAINRLIAGWIPLDDAEIVPADGTTVALAPSQGDDGTRLAVVALSPTQLLTVEFMTATGLQRHLPEDGVTVTLVDTATTSCGVAQYTTRSCRTHDSLVGIAPFDDLLGEPGESWQGSGWRVDIIALAEGEATVEIRPSSP